MGIGTNNGDGRWLLVDIVISNTLFYYYITVFNVLVHLQYNYFIINIMLVLEYSYDIRVQCVICHSI